MTYSSPGYPALVPAIRGQSGRWFDRTGTRSREDDDMLVLTRKLMEKLYIGNDVCVTVVRLEGGQVRLGIDAPRDVPVVRAELVDGREPMPRIHEETQGTPPPLSFKTRPAEARGIDIRRRGPSR